MLELCEKLKQKENCGKEIYCFEIFEVKGLPKSTDGKPANYAIKAIMGNGEEKLAKTLPYKSLCSHSETMDD